MIRLKGEDDNWLEDQASIDRSFLNFFQNLFNSTGSRDFSFVLQYVKRQVTENLNIDSVNQCLIKKLGELLLS